MKKTLAIVLSLFALAYVGLAYAEDSESSDSQNSSEQEQQSKEKDKSQRKQDREQKKREWEQKREGLKKIWEQDRERLKQEWETTREAAKNAREQFKEEFQQRLEEKKKLKEEFKEKFNEDRCAKIEEKIKERTEHFGERENAHKKVYVNLINRLNKFVSRFKAANLTTTSLEDNIATLQGMIGKFKTDYAAYIAKLGESKSFTCGHSEGEFRGTLVDARAELTLVHQDAAAIRDYVRTVIIPEIKVLKAQMPEEQDDEDKKDEEDKDENKTPDTTKPTVTITAPSDTSSFAAGSTVTISADATDNDEVEKVEFYEGGVLKGKSEDAPYIYNWVTTSADAGAHLWTVKAYDDAEPANVGESAAVTVTIN